MSLSLNESLSKLEKLSHDQRHRTNWRVRAELAGADWKMAVCLLASARRHTFRHLGYSSITEYAQKALNLLPQKTHELLNAASALESLPRLSEAFQNAQIGWGKMRELKRVAKPETETQWLEFALAHSTAEVRKKVSLSPRGWKRNQALKASQAKQPVATPGVVSNILEAPEAPVIESTLEATETPS